MRALFSLTNTRNAKRFARRLIALGWEIVASEETVAMLRAAALPVTALPEFFKVAKKYPFPPTLHPEMELGLTTTTGLTIDLVYITTYPLPKGNDVGGHTLLGLAAKGERIAVTDPADMEKVLLELESGDNRISSGLRQDLLAKAQLKIARHYLALLEQTDKQRQTAVITGQRHCGLLEGENPYQQPADFLSLAIDDQLALPAFQQRSDNLPCFTNLADFDSILQTMCLLAAGFRRCYRKTPYIVIGAKHGNPVGLAVSWKSPAEAIRKTLLTDPQAIFGGEVIVNFALTAELAELLVASGERRKICGSALWCLDVLAAPAIGDAALAILQQRKRLKIFVNKALTRPCPNPAEYVTRMVRGGLLRQPPADYVLDLNKYVAGKQLSAAATDSLLIAWAVAWSSSLGGNEVALAKDRMLLAAGGGPSTVEACRTALRRAQALGGKLKGAVFAADAFFPFTDGPQELAGAGCRYGVVPGGGKNFALVEQYFRKKHVKVFFLPEEYRGFCRH